MPLRSKAALKMFGEILAKEEPELTSVSIRPGVVDTEMQSVIRTKGKKGYPQESLRNNVLIK